MLPEDLEQKLKKVDSSRNTRVETAYWIVKKPHYVRETLQWCFRQESELLINASWVLEFICKNQPKLFFKYKYIFFERLPSIKEGSALRSCAKICETLCYHHYMLRYTYFRDILSMDERKTMTECCFDWLITDQKVACQAPAMSALYYLGRDKRDNMGAWIFPELRNILTENAPNKSAGYQARARKILKKIG